MGSIYLPAAVVLVSMMDVKKTVQPIALNSSMLTGRGWWGSWRAVDRVGRGDVCRGIATWR